MQTQPPLDACVSVWHGPHASASELFSSLALPVMGCCSASTPSPQDPLSTSSLPRRCPLLGISFLLDASHLLPLKRSWQWLCPHRQPVAKNSGVTERRKSKAAERRGPWDQRLPAGAVYLIYQRVSLARPAVTKLASLTLKNGTQDRLCAVGPESHTQGCSVPST